MEENKAGIHIEKKTFFSSVAILAVLMALSGILTRILPTGSFRYVETDGMLVIVPSSFAFVESAPYPVWRWVTAPVEVLFSPDNVTVIAIILFLMIIGGTFAVLDRCGMLQYIMNKLVERFGSEKYKLMAVMIFFFMFFGSVFGTFEEMVALVPMVILLSYALGWDSLTGLGMSALAAGFGFACATLNPFTLGVAQQLSGVPAFSGLLFRIVMFLLCYIMLFTFMYRYSRKIEKNPQASCVYHEDQQARSRYTGQDRQQALPKEQEAAIQKAVRIFSTALVIVVGYILVSFFITALSALALPVMALLFLTGGLLAGKASCYTEFSSFRTSMGKDFLKGVSGILPGVALILFANSVKLIIERGGIMDTILYYASEQIAAVSPYTAAVLIYLLVMGLNFFVGSGSAKAFLVIPIIAPLTELVGITRQVAVQAFCFGDGFTNMLYPTNPMLMITLGVTVVSYGKWLKWCLPIQLIMFAGSIAALAAAVALGYGPY